MYNKLSDKYKVVKRHKQESKSFIKKEQVLSDKDKEIFYISEKLKLDKQLVKEILELVKFRISPTGSEELKTNFISALKKINYEIFAKEIRKGVVSKKDPNIDNNRAALIRLLKMFELDRNMMLELYNQNISKQVSDFSKWALDKISQYE